MTEINTRRNGASSAALDCRTSVKQQNDSDKLLARYGWLDRWTVILGLARKGLIFGVVWRVHGQDLGVTL